MVRMGAPAARLGDAHTCPVTSPAPHVGGVLATGEATVCIRGVPSARTGDTAVCVGAPGAGNVVVTGSSTVLIKSLPAARVGDTTSHGGVIVAGEPTVLIGG